MGLVGRAYLLGRSAHLHAWTFCSHRALWTTHALYAGEKWRLERGLGKCGNEYGPLTDIPDWSYADGRPAPLSPREIKRREKSKEMTHRIMELMDEMQGAKTMYAKRQQEAREHKEKILKQKLKPRLPS